MMPQRETTLNVCLWLYIGNVYYLTEMGVNVLLNQLNYWEGNCGHLLKL